MTKTVFQYLFNFIQLAYKDMNDYINKVVAPLESKAEELILHILPRAL